MEATDAEVLDVSFTPCLDQSTTLTSTVGDGPTVLWRRVGTHAVFEQP